MASQLRYANGVTIQNSDTTGATKYQDVSVTANVPVIVGEIVVPTDSRGATWGGGKMFAVLFDDTTTAAREEGEWVFKVRNNTSFATETVFRARSEVVGAAGQVSVPSEWNFMPVGAKLAPAGGSLIAEYISDATDILDSTDCTIVALPYTVYY